MMLWKCGTENASKFGKLSSGHRTGKGQFSFQSQRKAMPRNVQIIAQFHSSHMLANSNSRIILKILQARLQQYMNCGLPHVQAVYRKGRGTRHQIPSIRWIIEKAREFQKNIYFCVIDYSKIFDYFQNCGKLIKWWEYQTTWPASREMCMHVKKQQNWTWNNWLVLSRERSLSRLYIVTLLI